MGRSEHDPGAEGKSAWNAGRKLGAKRALKPQQVWAIRLWLDSKERMRDRAMFDLAIDSKLRGCDIVKIKIGGIVLGGRVRSRATVGPAEDEAAGAVRVEGAAIGIRLTTLPGDGPNGGFFDDDGVVSW